MIIFNIFYFFQILKSYLQLNNFIQLVYVEGGMWCVSLTVSNDACEAKVRTSIVMLLGNTFRSLLWEGALMIWHWLQILIRNTFRRYHDSESIDCISLSGMQERKFLGMMLSKPWKFWCPYNRISNGNRWSDYKIYMVPMLFEAEWRTES